MRWRGYEYQQRRPWIPDQVGDDSKRKGRFLGSLGMTDKDKGPGSSIENVEDDSKGKEANRRMLLPPLRPCLQRRGNDGRHEMARLQLQKEDKGNDEILHCVQDDR